MPTFHDTYVGFAEEATYAPVAFTAPTNFLEFLSEGIQGKYERIESEGLRAATSFLRSDRWERNPKGAEGDLKFEALDVGLDLILKHALGAISSAAPVGGFTTHTITPGDIKGKSLAVKVGRVDVGGTINPFDYSGGKIKSWEFSNAVDGILQGSLDMDFAKEATGGAAGTPTYPAFTTQLLTFVGGFVTIAGTDFAVSDVSIKGENGLKTDRYALRQGAGNSTTKREPLIEGLRNITFDLKGEFEGLTHYNRVAAATTAGAQAAIVLQWDSPQGGQLKFDIPIGRFDEAPINVDGAKVIEQALTGKVLWSGSGAPITVTYKAKSV